MNPETLLYEGKAKQVYSTAKDDEVLIQFKNSATAFNNLKKAEFEGKGKLNCKISTAIFSYLKKNNIDSHFVRLENELTVLAKKVSIIPLEVVVRNYTAGSLSKRYGVPEREKVEPTIIEFYLKNDGLGDPLLTEDHIAWLKIATREEVATLKKKALELNTLLVRFFDSLGITLADFKVEYGRFGKDILLADEISPDTCRLWDQSSDARFDKDVFRRDLGSLIEAYQEVEKRMLNKGYL